MKNYKYRKSESEKRQPEVEYLQDGILVRFNFQQVERKEMEGKTMMWEYDEYWFPKNTKVEEIESIVKKEKHELTKEYKELLDKVKLKK